MYLAMRLGLFDAQSLEQPLQLTPGYRPTSIRLRRPSEATFFQSPAIQPKAIVAPAQDFQFVPPPVAEHEPLVPKRVKGEDGAYERRQSIDGFAQIGRPGCKKDPPHRFRVQHGPPTARRVSDRSLGSNPGRSSMRSFPIRSWIPGSASAASSAMVTGTHWAASFAIPALDSFRRP